MSVTRSLPSTSANDDPRWRAVLRRDRRADGSFVFGVETTGVYCRPSCSARRPRREHVRFFEAAADAEKAGFRACRRCHPNDPSWTERQTAVITAACRRIEEAEESPSLAALANAAGMSRFHFHRLFKTTTGLTPKAYATAHRSERMRAELGRRKTVTEAIYEAGFNSNGRFYAKSSGILGMKPKDYRNRGRGAAIRFAVGKCSLGSILVAASEKGICAIFLGDDPAALINDLAKRFPKAQLIAGDRNFQDLVAKVIRFVEAPRTGLDLPLDLRGTVFQRRVWKALREIPIGTSSSYSEIAKRIGAPKSVRAVARAIASNRLAVVVPCHRVLGRDGSISGYRWGVERKISLLKNEQIAPQPEAEHQALARRV
jgi:AraC family transcriptional regulator, regulatory protein of adaptative response / methylated-DNA-[protein]-cysteine methyltransferase